MSEKKWTLDRIPDLSGKIILITGANSGLGLVSSKAMAARGATVIMACRSLSKGEKARLEILQAFPQAKIELAELDLANLETINSFSQWFLSRFDRLDILLNNAGIMMTPYQLTKDGFESQMGTNHLGHYALSGLLMELIRKTPNARVVTVSSMAHKRGEMDFSNLLFSNGKEYNPIRAYSRSKLSNLLFTFELQRFFERHQIDAISVAAHPGAANTNLFNHLVPEFIKKTLVPVVSFMVQSADMGALPQLRAAVDPDVKGGSFYGPGGFFEFTGYPKEVKAIPSAYDLTSAEELWKESATLTGVRFDG